MIEEAISNTKSNSEASRWLGVSFTTYKKYAKMFDLYENHKNQAGKGVTKIFKNHSITIEQILSNKIDNYPIKLLKKRGLVKSPFLYLYLLLCCKCRSN